MEKSSLRKLFLLLSTGLIITGCATDTEETPEETQAPATEEVEDVAEDATTEDTATEDAASEDAEEITATFDILIDGEAVADLSKEVTVPEGTYVMDVMHEEYDVVDEGGFLSEIEGYEQDTDAGRFWMYYVNGESAPVGATEYELEDGDSVEWRLEDSEF